MSDAYWRRPAEETTRAEEAPVAPEPYTGPPPTTPPPAEAWRGPVITPPAPPRQLPEQDHAALDAEDERSRAVTLGVGILAGAVLLVLLIVVLVLGGAAASSPS